MSHFLCSSNLELYYFQGRKLSPTNTRLTPEPRNDKDDGISDEEDPAELKLLLELNEQEASVLRKKVEELEADNDRLKRKTKDMQDKLNTKTVPKKNIFGNEKGGALQDKKLKVSRERWGTYNEKAFSFFKKICIQKLKGKPNSIPCFETKARLGSLFCCIVAGTLYHNDYSQQLLPIQ